MCLCKIVVDIVILFCYNKLYHILIAASSVSRSKIQAATNINERWKNIMYDNYLSPFPRRFRLLIDETRVSQQEIADHVGVTRQAIAQWKDGKTNPDVYSFVKIAEFFKVPYEYLLGETDSKVRENMKIADEFKISDIAINRLLDWASAKKENKSDVPRSEVFSDLLASDDFEKFIDSVRKFIAEYLEHRFYEDEQNESSIHTDTSLDLTPYELDQHARTIGHRIIEARDFSDFFRHQALEILGWKLSLMPEEYYIAYHLAEDIEPEEK
jgi:transcriptional regulator with XRE-family HTH domain